MLSLEFEENGTGHQDLVLTLGDRQWRADSYYLALDGALFPDREDAPKIRAVLHRLLQQWLDLVATLADRRTVYLAYDFSDQCTAWIECSREQDAVTLRLGWSTLEGWALSPSELGQHALGPRGFQHHEGVPAISVGHDELQRLIKASMVTAG